MTKEQKQKVLARIESMRQRIRDDSDLFVHMQSYLVAVANSPSPRRELVESFSIADEATDYAARMTIEAAMIGLAMLSLDLMQEESARNN